MNWKESKGSSHGLFQGIITAFACRDWQKTYTQSQ